MRSKTAYLCLALALLLSLAACKGQADEQDSQPPVTPTVAPTQEPTPTPTPPIPYTDVSEDADYYNAVVWAYKNGIASDGTTFEPDSACTRGQVITFLWRAMGSPEPQITECPISDVAPSDWFYTPVLWAYEIGISTSSTFNPGNPCSNAEVLTFLWRAEGKPAAAVHNSPVALAASGAYYERPAAWAETNGMLGSNFDPSAPCSRAGLMMYLHWLTEEWTFAEEDKTLQAEYEQIINDAQLYEVHGSGLVYADYVDVDGDGAVELLTVDTGENLSTVPGIDAYDVTATIYANVDGHAAKYCEQSFEFTSRDCSLYVCAYDGYVYIRYEIGIYGPHNGFYKVENGAFILSEQIDEEMGTYYVNNSEVSETEYNAAMGKYINRKELFHYFGYNIGVVNRGLLPDPTAELQKIYAAVKNGDFSAFAGTYTDGLTMDQNGVLTGTGVASRKPSYITVRDDGAIMCFFYLTEAEIVDIFHVPDVAYEEQCFIIYPVGVCKDYGDPAKVRLEYWPTSYSVTMVEYTKVS